MAYVLRCRDVTLATAATEHAAVDLTGRVRRLPRDRVERLRGLAHSTGILSERSSLR